MNTKERLYKILRYILFIPALFISFIIFHFLSLLFFKLLSFFSYEEFGIIRYLFIDGVIHFFTSYISISISLMVYPSDNKKIGFIIISIVIFILLLISGYLTFFNPMELNMTRMHIIGQVVKHIAIIIAYIYTLKDYKNNKLEL